MSNILSIDDLEMLNPEELKILLIQEVDQISPNIQYIKNLIAVGCPINFMDANGLRPVDYSANHRNLECLKLLIEHGAVIVELKEKTYAMTALPASAYNGDLNCMEFMFSKEKIDVNSTFNFGIDDYNSTLLHAAAKGGHLNVISYLLSMGAEINARDYEGRTPLHMASRRGNTESCELLIENGANIKLEASSNMNMLHYAALGGNIRYVKLMLQEGFSINSINKWGGTPLHFAAISGSENLIEVLLANGADAKLVDDFNFTPLHYVALTGNIDAIPALILNGCDINAKNYSNRTALHYAVDRSAKKQNDMIRSLLKYGIDIGIKSDIGFTAWDFASQEIRDLIPELYPY